MKYNPAALTIYITGLKQCRSIHHRAEGDPEDIETNMVTFFMEYCVSSAVVNCSDLAAPTNGSVELTAATFGATAVYTCDEGFNIDGTDTRTCHANGQWSGSPPTCNSEFNDPVATQQSTYCHLPCN